MFATAAAMAPSGFRTKLSVAWKITNETIDEFSKDRGDLVAAALAFYALLSLAPLIIIAVAIAGVILGRGAAQTEVTRLLGETMGPTAATTVNDWVRQASESGGVASLIGGVLVLFAASRLGLQVRSALNQIWNVEVYMGETLRLSVLDYLKRRAFGFLLVLASGPLLLAVVVSRAVLSGVNDVLFARFAFSEAVVQLSQVGFSLVLIALVSAFVFKFVPDTRIGWKSVIWGSVLTSVLFNLGSLLAGLYLGRASVSATYGAAGSAVVILLWLNISSQIFLFGAEFTQVYSRHFGRGLSPDEQRALEREEGPQQPPREPSPA